MIPPPPASLANFGLYWTDEQIFLSLDKFMKGSSLPEDVISDINPYQYKPYNLPDGLWYFVNSTERKETELGVWKARGEACQIYKDSILSGWRTTLEYFEGPAPLGQQTDWLMQEYKITETSPNGKNEPKDIKTLCRIFRCGGEGPSTETDADNYISSAESTSRRDSRNDTQVKNMESPVTERVSNPNPVSENLLDLDYILSGDYLELDDLADQDSRASSSDNSSCLSTISDEFFHSLLREIEDDPNNEQQKNGSSSKFSVAAFARPNEVVMHPVSVGSLSTAIASKSPDEKKGKSSMINPNVGKQKAEYRNEGASSSHLKASMSDDHKAISRRENVSGSKKKFKKKYLCFMPF